jgi:hypothetical protein
VGLRRAPTAITDIILTLARLTAITGLIGFPAAYSLAPARGMAGDARGVGAAGVGAAVGATVTATTAAAASWEDGATTADAGTLADAVTHAAELAATMEAEGITVAAAFMAEAASTVAEVGTAVADTGNRS